MSGMVGTCLFAAADLLMNTTFVLHTENQKNIASKLIDVQKRFGNDYTSDELQQIYTSLVPDIYDTKNMISFAFNDGISKNYGAVDTMDFASGCGYCPCLCIYCPPKSISCCLPSVRDDANCMHCSYPDGHCDVCKPGYSIGWSKTCMPNKKCTHKGKGGICVKCDKNFSLDRSNLLCFRNPKCTRKNRQGICVRCKPRYELEDDTGACIAKPGKNGNNNGKKRRDLLEDELEDALPRLAPG